MAGIATRTNYVTPKPIYKPPAGRVQQGGYTTPKPTTGYYTPPAGRIEQGGYTVGKPAAPGATAPPSTSTPPTAAPAPAPAAAPGSYDYSGDPILQAIRAQAGMDRTSAQAASDAARKQIAILLGDASGIIDDQGTAEAAKGNAFSTLARLASGYKDTTHGIDESANKANLFYSGHRGKWLGDALRNYEGQQYDARTAAQAQLGTVNQTLADALRTARQNEIQGEQDAYGRALQNALTYGIDPGAAASQAAAPAASAAAPSASSAPSASVPASPVGAMLTGAAYANSGGGDGLKWDGQTFTTWAQFNKWLAARGMTRAQFEASNPAAAARLK